jgi:hypothetical protein
MTLWYCGLMVVLWCCGRQVKDDDDVGSRGNKRAVDQYK